jgi:hypothetical protein
MSADTINHILGISCAMSADTNNVSGIRGVPRRRETLITVKFGFAPSGCPIFPPSMPLLPWCLRHLPRRHTVAITVINPTFGLDAVLPPTPSPTPPSTSTLPAVSLSSSPTPSLFLILSHCHFEGQCCRNSIQFGDIISGPMPCGLCNNKCLTFVTPAVHESR